MICEILASIELSASADPHLRFISWPEISAKAPASTRTASHPARIPSTQGGYIVPDVIFGLEYLTGSQKAYRFFALEVDRGTMPVVRASGEQSSYRRKLLAYRDIIGRQVHRTHLGILNDWHFSQELSGTFFAFRANGEQIIRRRFKANLYNNGLSRDGRYAVCQTASSPDSSDSAMLFVFDLVRGIELASWRAESGWASGYEFSDDGRHVQLLYPQGQKLTYTLTGEFLDRQCWIDDALNGGDLYMIDRVLKETGKLPRGEWAQRLLTSCDTALKADRYRDDQMRAWAHKLRGKCLEGLESYSEALAAYDLALKLDSKAGVKRRADQLRKKLAEQP